MSGDDWRTLVVVMSPLGLAVVLFAVCRWLFGPVSG